MNDSKKSGRPPTLPLFVTDWHDCSYLPNLRARTLFVDPTMALDGTIYQALLARGFRRSGAHVYRPACGTCQRCVSIRIPVDAFAPSRSQRRNLALNRDQIELSEHPARFDPEQYALYRAYVRSRHRGGSMGDAAPERYFEFLAAPWGGETRFLELRLEGRLVAVAVTDVLPGCLSAVYTFFDPDVAERALGTYAILCQIEEARRLGFEYLYLGYWIEECSKMSYKERFRPLEARIDEHWKRFDRGDEIG